MFRAQRLGPAATGASAGDVLILKAVFLQNTKKWKKMYILILEYKDVAQGRRDR